MIRQPERENRNVNDFFYESEARRIALLNRALGNIELSKAEEHTLVWLAGWEECTVQNIISAFQKAGQTAEIMRLGQPQQPPARRKT